MKSLCLIPLVMVLEVAVQTIPVRKMISTLA